jgi:glycosyltransferase involved in cell wall biosynthesis
LIVQATGEIGGAEVALLGFLDTVSRAEVEPLVAVLRPGPLVTRLAAMSVDLRVIDVGPHLRQVQRTVAGIWRVARLARGWGADLVHSNGTKSHLYGGPAALLARKPYLWQLCDMLLPDTSPLYTLAAWIPSDLIVTDSDAVARQARSFSRRLGRMRTIYHGTPMASGPTAVDDAAVRAELGLPPHGHVVAVIGRLQRWKGQDDVIRAAPAILGAFPDAHVLVVGGTLFGLDPDYPAELARLVGELGLEARVHLTGQRSDVARLLSAVDVVVVPSRLPEPFGIVQIEAMAAGKPLVSSAAGGNLEVVEHGRTGFLVPPADPAAIATAVCTLLGQPELRRRMGEAGRLRAVREFTVERMTANIVSAYRSVLQLPLAPEPQWT